MLPEQAFSLIATQAHGRVRPPWSHSSIRESPPVVHARRFTLLPPRCAHRHGMSAPCDAEQICQVRHLGLAPARHFRRLQTFIRRAQRPGRRQQRQGGWNTWSTKCKRRGKLRSKARHRMGHAPCAAVLFARRLWVRRPAPCHKRASFFCPASARTLWPSAPWRARPSKAGQAHGCWVRLCPPAQKPCHRPDPPTPHRSLPQ